MPYKTASGKHYHMTIGCHGATIPCGIDGLDPCSDCCGGNKSGTASSSAASATVGFSVTGRADLYSQPRDESTQIDGMPSEEVIERLLSLRDTLDPSLASLPMPQGFTDSAIANLTDEEAARVVKLAMLMTYEANKAISNRRRKKATQQYDQLSDASKKVIDSIPEQQKLKVNRKRANKYRGEIYEILIAHSGEDYDEGSDAKAELDEKLSEYKVATGEPFPMNVLAQMRNEADEARNILKTAIPNIATVRRVGNETKNQDGDLLVTTSDGQVRMVEVKRAKGGLGTYLNTSIDNAVASLSAPVEGTDLSRFKTACGGKYETMPSYTQFLDDSGYREELRGIIGSDKVSPEGTASFVKDKAAESAIRNDKATYDAVKKAVAKHTASYRNMLYAYLLDTGQVESFSRGCISKSLSGKSAPDLLIATNTSKSPAETKILSPGDILANGIDGSLDKQGDASIGFSAFRVTFAWQNGTGLRNSTMRVFLDHNATDEEEEDTEE